MKRPKSSLLFVARSNYRLRRLMDAARMLPFFGLLLLLLPLLRPTRDQAAPPTATEAVYVFVIWAMLIVLAALLAVRLRHILSDESSSSPGAGLPRPDAPHPVGQERPARLAHLRAQDQDMAFQTPLQTPPQETPPDQPQSPDRSD